MPDSPIYSLDSFSYLTSLKGMQISKAIKISFQEQHQPESCVRIFSYAVSAAEASNYTGPLFHAALKYLVSKYKSIAR